MSLATAVDQVFNEIEAEIVIAKNLLDDYRELNKDYFSLSQELQEAHAENKKMKEFIETFQNGDIVAAMTEHLVKPIGLFAKLQLERNLELTEDITAYSEYAQETSAKQDARIQELEKEVEVQRLRADEAQISIVQLNDDLRRYSDTYGTLDDENVFEESADWNSSDKCW